MKNVVFIIIFSTLSLMILSPVVAVDAVVNSSIRPKKEKKDNDLYRNQLSFYIMPGSSWLGYKTIGGVKSSGGFSFGGGIGYTFWFNKYIGLGAGLQMNYYTGNLKFSSLRDSLNGIDNSDNIQNRYTLMQTINGKEQQRVTYFEIPILLNFSVPLTKKLDFVANVGGSFGINISESFKMASGNYQRSLHFPDINVDINSSESLHLGTFTKFSPSSTQFSSNFSIIGDVGLKVKLTQRTHLSFLVTGGYGVTNVKAQNVPFVSINQYKGVTTTNHIGNINTSYIGGKIALNVGLGKTKKQEIQNESEYDFPLNYTVPVQEDKQAQTFQEVVPLVQPIEKVTKPTLTPAEERAQKIAELKTLLKQLSKTIIEKKVNFGKGSHNLTFEVQDILTQASDLINSTKTPIMIVCQSCKQATPKANKAVGGRKAQSVKKAFLDFKAENTYVRIRVVKCKTPKTEGEITFMVVEDGALKDVKKQSTKPTTVKSRTAKKESSVTSKNRVKRPNTATKNNKKATTTIKKKKSNTASSTKKKSNREPRSTTKSSTVIKFSDLQ